MVVLHLALCWKRYFKHLFLNPVYRSISPKTLFFLINTNIASSIWYRHIPLSIFQYRSNATCCMVFKCFVFVCACFSAFLEAIFQSLCKITFICSSMQLRLLIRNVYKFDATPKQHTTDFRLVLVPTSSKNELNSFRSEFMG